MDDRPATFLECFPNFPSPSYLICNIHLYHIYHIYHPYYIYIYISRAIMALVYLAEFLKTFLKTGQKFRTGFAQVSHRFLVTAVRKNIGDLLSWLVSLSSSVPELTRHGLERGLNVNPQGGGVLEKPGTVRQSCSGGLSALVMSALSLICQILLMFEAHWPMKTFPLSTC